jgi:hypothetical protein
MLASGASLKLVQELLGHSTITLTGDVYTTVLAEVARAAACRTLPARSNNSCDSWPGIGLAFSPPLIRSLGAPSCKLLT